MTQIGARSLLRLNGVNFHIYYSTFFLLMGSLYFLEYIGLLVIVAAFGIDSLTMEGAFANLAILFFLYMPVTLMVNAVASYMFDKSETARTYYPNLTITIGLLAYTIVSMIDMLVPKEDVDPALILHCIFTIFLPYYIPFGILYYINKVYLMCKVEDTCGTVSFTSYMTTELVIVYAMCFVDIILFYLLLRVIDAVKAGGSMYEALYMKV